MPNEKIVERIRFDAPSARRDDDDHELRPVDGGTEVTILTENLPAAIRPRTTTRARARRWAGSRRSWNAEFREEIYVKSFRVVAH